MSEPVATQIAAAFTRWLGKSRWVQRYPRVQRVVSTCVLIAFTRWRRVHLYSVLLVYLSYHNAIMNLIMKHLHRQTCFELELLYFKIRFASGAKLASPPAPNSTLIIEKYSPVTKFLCKPHENVMSESHRNLINIWPG